MKNNMKRETEPGKEMMEEENVMELRWFLSLGLE
jgi:hypothetical protein